MDLRVWLWENKLTTVHFAERLECNRCHLAQIASYKRMPSLKLARKIEQETRGQVKARYIMSKAFDEFLEKQFKISAEL
jgi:transcriptional regulator with XRE-family HTH domain